MADLDALLAGTSRTFALAIPFLPAPLDRQVTLAYLLLRIADTLEDAEQWSSERKIAELNAFAALLRADGSETARGFCDRLRQQPPRASAPCLELLEATDEVMKALGGVSPPAQSVVTQHVLATVRGMAEVLGNGRAGTTELKSLEQLRHYCYIVAGLVGELLTELFLLEVPTLAPMAEKLRVRARIFGEGLQLTNILKDEREDSAAGRRFLPSAVPLGEVFALARADLAEAVTYVELLRSGGAPRGMLEFTAVPVRLAVETLDAVEARGSGAKVSRQRVGEILASVARAIDEHTPLFPP